MQSSVLASAPSALSAAFVNRIATFQVRRGVGGVLANGASNPLSKSFATLAAAQAVFPHATALTDELDWAVTQGQVNAAQAAGGGVVEIGEGQFVTSGKTVTLPGSAYEGAVGAVSMVGAGFDTTRLIWLTDGPVGSYVITCANRDTGISGGFLRDLGLQGPGGNPGSGNFPCGVSGLAWGARRQCDNLLLTNLRVGLSIKGDHTPLRNIRPRQCGYGMYFDQPNPYLFGNLRFESYECDGCSAAAIAVHPDAIIAGTVFMGGSSSLDGSPFGFYKEITNNNTNHVLFTDCRLDEVQMENIGNAAISGGSPFNYATDPQGVERPDIFSTRFNQCQMTYSQNGAFKNTNFSRAALIDTRTMNGVVIDGFCASHIWVPGDVAMMIGGNWSGVDIRGDIELLLANCTAAGKPIFSNNSVSSNGPNQDNSITVQQTGCWSGKLLASYPNSNIQPGDVLAGQIIVKQCTGVAGELAIGVARNAATNYATVIVATSGKVEGVACDAHMSDNTLVFAGPSGKLTATSGGKPLGSVVYSSSAAPFTASFRFY